MIALFLEYLSQKISIVESLKPKDLNDFIPLARVSPVVLMRTKKIIDKEREVIKGGNRIYFFSEELDLPPVVISKYFSTHMFMFEVTIEMLYENLRIMKEYNISSMSIVRDLWAFKYLGKSIRTRLERCKNGSKENLKPWMIRCTEEILQRSLYLTQESKNLLGDSSLVEFLSERLGYSTDAMETFIRKHPAVMKVRVTKVRHEISISNHIS